MIGDERNKSELVQVDYLQDHLTYIYIYIYISSEKILPMFGADYWLLIVTSDDGHAKSVSNSSNTGAKMRADIFRTSVRDSAHQKKVHKPSNWLLR